MSRLEKWAIAAISIVNENDVPLLLRTYTSPKSALQGANPACSTHLYVGREDITMIRLLIFASLDRCVPLTLSQPKTKQVLTRRQPDQRVVPDRPSRGGHDDALVSTRAPNDSVSSSSTPVALYTAIVESSVTDAASTEHARPKLTSTSDPRYLGVVLQDYRFTCYAFVTVSRLTVVLVSVGYVEAPGDAVMPLCRAVYEAASMAMCNPFRTAQRAWAMHKRLVSQYEARRRQSTGSEEQAAATAQGTASMQRPRTCTAGNDSAGDYDTDDMVLEQYLQLPEGVHEDSWPFAQNSFVDDPPLAFSRAFSSHIESILSGFTVSTRSVVAQNMVS